MRKLGPLRLDIQSTPVILNLFLPNIPDGWLPHSLTNNNNSLGQWLTKEGLRGKAEAQSPKAMHQNYGRDTIKDLPSVSQMISFSSPIS